MKHIQSTNILPVIEDYMDELRGYMEFLEENKSSFDDGYSGSLRKWRYYENAYKNVLNTIASMQTQLDILKDNIMVEGNDEYMLVNDIVQISVKNESFNQKKGEENSTRYITIDRQQFCSRIDPRTNTISIRSIHPYDETNYHWARQGSTGKNWVIYRDGHQIQIINRPMTEEQIARELLRLDKSARLTRTGGIW